MFDVVNDRVFPFLRTEFISGYGDGSTYAHHMKDARFTIPTPALLAKVVDLLDPALPAAIRYSLSPESYSASRLRIKKCTS